MLCSLLFFNRHKDIKLEKKEIHNIFLYIYIYILLIIIIIIIVKFLLFLELKLLIH